MAVLVTGGAGYIGSHMVLKLMDQKEDVIVLDDLSTGHEWSVPKGVPFYHADVADLKTLDDVFSRHDIDAVLHFAGAIVVQESVENPLKYYLQNSCKSRTLVDFIVARQVPHFLYSSSAAVYGAPGMEPVRETAPYDPQSPYGTSKLVAEWMLRDLAASIPAFRYAALRYFNVAGADPHMRSGQSSRVSTHLIKIAAEAAVGKRSGLQIYGDDFPTPDGTCVRDYIHVADLIDAHYCALEYLRNGGASLVANCGYGSGYSVRQVIDAVKAVSGADFEVSVARRRPGDAAMIVADPGLARKTLGWLPRFQDLDLIIAHAIEWERRLAEQ